MQQKNRTKRRSPKTVLRLPDLDHSKSSVLQSLGSAASQRTYRFAIDDFINWYCSEPRLAFGRTVVLRYRYALESRQLAPATINLRLAAVRRLAYEASDNGLLSPDLAASIRRVKGAKRLGLRLGNWLTAAQGKDCSACPTVALCRASETTQYWLCFWAAVCVGLNSLGSPSTTYNSETTTGQSLICLGRADTCGQFLFQPG